MAKSNKGKGTCRQCDGRGFFYFYPSGNRRCSVCGGSGKVRQSRKTKPR